MTDNEQKNINYWLNLSLDHSGASLTDIARLRSNTLLDPSIDDRLAEAEADIRKAREGIELVIAEAQAETELQEQMRAIAAVPSESVNDG